MNSVQRAGSGVKTASNMPRKVREGSRQAAGRPEHHAARGSEALPGLQAGPQKGSLKTAHHTHEINVYRGMFYYLKCGAYGSDKPKKLTTPCLPPQPVGQGGFSWSSAIDLICSGKLPSGAKAWATRRAAAFCEGGFRMTAGLGWRRRVIAVCLFAA